MVEQSEDYAKTLAQLRHDLEEAQKWGAFETYITVLAVGIMGLLLWFITL